MDDETEIFDARFSDCLLGNCQVERLYQGTLWAEGPVYFCDGDFLLWSDIPNNRMMKWTPGAGVTVFRQPSNYSNGHTRDRQGRLVSCEHGTRRVTRTEWDGTITVLADSYQGKRLNSPNDVVVKSDGSIWFSDPPYGILSDYEGARAAGELDGVSMTPAWSPSCTKVRSCSHSEHGSEKWAEAKERFRVKFEVPKTGDSSKLPTTESSSASPPDL